MKKFTQLLFCFFILNFISAHLNAQTATRVVYYSGFQACGGCTVCGSDYWCINTPGSYCGNTPACDSKTFIDPVPAGKIVTQVTVNYWTASCDAAAISGTINGFSVPVAYDGAGGCLCSSSPCMLSTSTTGSYPCGLPGYNYGGNNTLQLCTSTDMCINRAELVFTYVTPDVIYPSITPSGPTNFCQGGNVTLNAGTGYSAYSWSTGATTQTINVSATGTYTVSVTSTTGCTTGSATINVNSYPNPSVSVSHSNVTCAGLNNGTATASPSGGTPGYSYSWFPSGQTTQTATGLAANTYTVTVYDAHSCSVTGTTTVTAPSSLTASISSQTNVSCNGGSNGSATVSASGGTPGYNYAWAPSGGSGSTASSLSAGTYTVTVSDASGCTNVQTATITQPTALTASASATNTSCNGGSNGTATVSVSGGTSPYTYSWFPSGQTSPTATNLSVGTYSVTVTDNRGCTIVRSATVNQPAAISISTSKVDATCGNANGSATANPSGGTPGYTYLWSPGGSTSPTATGLLAGTYTVTVTDQNSCTSVANVSVNNTGAPSVTVTSSTNVNCFGGNNGAASISASGGTPGYSYLWSNGNTTTSISGVIANTYSVTVTDAFGCQANTSVVISQPSQLIASITGTTTPSCYGGNNGTATVSVSGGTPGYIYSWSPSGGSGPIATGLSAGTYSVTITDTHSCTTTTSASISQPSVLSANISSSTNVSCNGGSNGSITVSASGGTAGYTYLWTGGGSTPTITNITAGTYYVTVTDVNGCSTVTNGVVNQPSAILLTIPSITNVNCFGASTGQATAQASGGTSPINFAWSNGIFTATNPNLPAGTYYVTATDNNGCTATNTAVITQASAIVPTVTVNQNVSCFGGNNGSATVSATGGTSPYSYLWSNSSTNATINNLIANTYFVTVYDVNGCTFTSNTAITEPQQLVTSTLEDSVNCSGDSTGSINLTVSGGTLPYNYIWSNGPTSEDLSNLPVGNYSVIVTDGNSCSTFQTASIYSPDPIIASFNSTSANCGMPDGSITVSALGGIPGYTYLWDSNAGGGTSPTVGSLPSGTYFVTVTDANNCTLVASGDISNLTAATVSFDVVNNNLCNGDSTGSAHAIATGGTPPFTYLWSNGSSTDAISNVVAGIYDISVTDNNGCVTINNVTILQPDPMLINIVSATQISCFGGNNGSVTIQVLGGTPNYVYHWENSTGTTVGNAATLSNISADTYYLTVTDNNNCVSSFSGPFTQPTQLITNASEVVAASCYNSTNGSVIANASGATSPYTYLWDDPLSSTTDVVTGLTGNVNYHVTVTDANGCSRIDTAFVSAPSQINITANITSANCSASNGSVSIVVSGGTQPYTYIWTTGSNNDTILNLASGNYTVSVYDANSCSLTYTANVNNLIAGTIQVTQQTNVLCFGSSDGSATVTMQGGTSPFTYVWSDGQITNTATNLSAGTYSVTIFDANNCSDDTTITISQPSQALTSSISSQNSLCVGSNDGIANINPSYGTTPYTYLWSNGAVTSTINNLSVGTYSVTVSDANNCTTTNQTSVSQPTPLQFSVSSVDPTCGNGANGSALVSGVSGGTSPYTYAWTGGQSDSIATGLSAGTYIVTIVDSHMCDTTSIVTLYNPPSMYVSDTTIGVDNTNMGFINVTILGGSLPYSYLWSNGSTTANISNLPAGDYIVTITDANTCMITDTFTIDIPLKIPSVITPNSDKVNDNFEILGIAGYNDVSIEIYNRWGDVLFKFSGTGMEYTDATRRWDGKFNGKDLPFGSYVYIIKLGPEIDPITGVVSIIR